MKKIILSIAAFALMVGSIFAQVKITPAARAEFEKTIQIDPATKKPYNFGGMEIVIADWWSDPTAKPTTEKETYQKMYEQWIRETYNVNIYKKKTYEWADAPQKIKSICMTADSIDKSYVLISDSRSIFDYMEYGLFADLSKIKSVNFQDSKYNQAVIKKIRKGKSFYAFNYGPSEVRQVVFYNKKLVADAGFDPDFPYEVQKLGKWNWKNFELICKSTMKEGVYGFSAQTDMIAVGAVFSNGGCFVDLDKNGGFTNQTTNPKTVQALKWARDMYSKYADPGQGNWDDYMKSFAAGKSCFVAGELWQYDYYRSQLDPSVDIGIVSYPCGPSGVKGPTTAFDDNMMVIPSAYDNERAEKIMKAVDLFITANPYDSNYTLLDEPGFAKMDSRAVLETIQSLQTSGTNRYDTLIPNFSISPYLWGIIWKGSDTDPAAVFTEKKDEIDQILSKYSFVSE